MFDRNAWEKANRHKWPSRSQREIARKYLKRRFGKYPDQLRIFIAYLEMRLELAKELLDALDRD
jgi:hypothetical protein